MASLAQKDVTQATIVRKLASYERQNQTKKALWELENICRTLYILDFIDDVTLRQTVQKALNRGVGASLPSAQLIIGFDGQ